MLDDEMIDRAVRDQADAAGKNGHEAQESLTRRDGERRNGEIEQVYSPCIKVVAHTSSAHGRFFQCARQQCLS